MFTAFPHRLIAVLESADRLGDFGTLTAVANGLSAVVTFLHQLSRPPMHDQDILLNDPPCVVVNKPGGILVQSPPGIDSLVDQLRSYECRRLEMDPERVYIGVPHRLDRPVSGAIVFARTRKAANRLSEQFAGRLVGKEYWALVAGRVTPSQGMWRDEIRKLPGEARAEIVPADHPDGRIAVLHYVVQRYLEFGTWLRIRLETGRMHQIRVQAGARGFPILGDEQYGSDVGFGPQTDDWRARWIGLHARSLTFRHTKTREKLRVTAPVPEPWRQLLPEAAWQIKHESVFAQGDSTQR